MYRITCLYCDYSWCEHSINMKDLDSCIKCGDRNLKVKETRDSIDYYAGSPKFENELPLDLEDYWYPGSSD